MAAAFEGIRDTLSAIVLAPVQRMLRLHCSDIQTESVTVGNRYASRILSYENYLSMTVELQTALLSPGTPRPVRRAPGPRVFP